MKTLKLFLLLILLSFVSSHAKKCISVSNDSLIEYMHPYNIMSVNGFKVALFPSELTDEQRIEIIQYYRHIGTVIHHHLLSPGKTRPNLYDEKWIKSDFANTDSMLNVSREYAIYMITKFGKGYEGLAIKAYLGYFAQTVYVNDYREKAFYDVTITRLHKKSTSIDYRGLCFD